MIPRSWLCFSESMLQQRFLILCTLGECASELQFFVLFRDVCIPFLGNDLEGNKLVMKVAMNVGGRRFPENLYCTMARIIAKDHVAADEPF